jgi:hypothetical protein
LLLLSKAQRKPLSAGLVSVRCELAALRDATLLLKIRATVAERNHQAPRYSGDGVPPGETIANHRRFVAVIVLAAGTAASPASRSTLAILRPPVNGHTAVPTMTPAAADFAAVAAICR